MLFYGDVDSNWRAFGLEPYDLSSAWLKAFAENDDDLRRSFRLELATEKEDFATLVAMHRPVWIVRSCLRAPSSSDEWLVQLAASGSKASVLLVGAGSRREAEAWMLAVPRAMAATVGEAEIAFRSLLRGCRDVSGLVRRNEGSMLFSGPCEVVLDLNEIPSPFQWQFIRRTGEVIAMQYGRRNPPRFWSSERLFGDIRWALDRSHYRILWLDESLPSDEAKISTWVGAIRRADPSEKIVRHLYRIDGTQSVNSLEQLSLLPTHTLTLTGQYPDSLREKAVRRLASQVVALRDERGTSAESPGLVQHAFALQPLWHQKTLPGWQLLNTTFIDKAASAEFVWNEELFVRLRLQWTGREVKATLEANGEPRPPEQQLARLQQAVAVLTARRPSGNQRVV